MNEFHSQLEDLMVAEELLFDSTPGFGSSYKKFLSHAIAHPAKMNTKLLEFLIDNFTEPNETVLDPMCGSGSTGVVAALHGRNAVQVDIEGKFVKWADEAKRKVEVQGTLTRKGSITNICGDSRRLSTLLKEADVVVTSPPFADSFRHNPQDREKRLQKLIEVDREGVRKGQKWAVTSREALERRLAQQDDGYGENPSNIGNLKHGEISTIITSPPYKTEMRGSGLNKNDKGLELGCKWDGYSKNPENIDNLPYGVDVIVTSPPYAESIKKDAGGKCGLERVGVSTKTARKYSESEENIGNLPFADAIITSPPYEGSLEGGSRHTKGGIASRDPALAQTGTYATRLSFGVPVGYSPKKDNIGNLKKETYLEAMLQVYQEMWKVLKPNGKTIIVIKPFIRNKKVVDLPYHTWLLLKKAGFKLIKLFKLRLKQQSFWRILYHKKYPKVPEIKHEYVLICQKRRGVYGRR